MTGILDTLGAHGSFQTLLALMEMASLSGRLQEPGPFTLFAPDDEAFQRVNVEEISGDLDNLVLLLNYHLVEGKLTAVEIAANEQLMTISGKSLTVRLEEGLQVIDNARCARTDIECDNGIIQVIDNVFCHNFPAGTAAAAEKGRQRSAGGNKKSPDNFRAFFVALTGGNQTLLTFAACSPFGPFTTSKVTSSPS